MSTKTENYMSNDDSHIINYTEKGISIASIIFSLYVLYTSFLSQKYRTITSIMKIQLTITCIIHMIPYLFEEQSLFSCSFQTFLLASSMFNTVQFPTILTIITYYNLKIPDTMIKKENVLKWLLSFLSWIIAILGGGAIVLFSAKGKGDDLVCWLSNDSGIIILCIVSFVYLMIILIILYKIKRKLLLMIKNEEIDENAGAQYINSFNKFFLFTMLALSSLILEVITSYIAEIEGISDKVYFILVFISCLIDILLYPVIIGVFCFTKVPVNELLPCLRKNNKVRNGYTISLIQSK